MGKQAVAYQRIQTDQIKGALQEYFWISCFSISSGGTDNTEAFQCVTHEQSSKSNILILTDNQAVVMSFYSVATFFGLEV